MRFSWKVEPFMNSEFYREFIAIVETKNFAEAADLLSLSTSTISRHLRAVEDELGVDLFDRTARGIQLNVYGELFLTHAQEMLCRHDAFTQELHRMREKNRNVIFYSTNYQFNHVLFAFRKAHPLLELVKLQNRSHPLENLRDGKCELAFVIGLDSELEMEGLERIAIGTDRLVVALHQSHPLAGKQSIDLKLLSDYPFIILLSKITGEPYCDPFKRAGFQPEAALSVSTGEEALALVSQNYGATLIMRNPAERAGITPVKLIDLEGEDEQTVYMCKVRGKKLSSAANTMWRFIDAYSKREI